ncbi:hypothetical protein C2845_PM05G21660 [Panicum miliaceum]|uniref:Uncharacterized protein n=1 Tax=Panicum miliaceum TaxID=4540 RepID=A0A3L6T3R8_PANMI|nr:hypothetical protein C2845_PM05G21660 [Panicum miliaceum]
MEDVRVQAKAKSAEHLEVIPGNKLLPPTTNREAAPWLLKECAPQPRHPTLNQKELEKLRTGDLRDKINVGRDAQSIIENRRRERAGAEETPLNRPKTVSALRDMMQTWADQEEQERDRFSKSGNDYNNKRNNDHRNDRSQRDYSGSRRGY